VIEEMSLGIHYNTGGHDLLTYLKDKSVFALEDGFVKAPTGPGLGIEVDEDLIRALAREMKPWRNPIFRTRDGNFAEW
jgi:galactonate dehydratase